MGLGGHSRFKLPGCLSARAITGVLAPHLLRATWLESLSRTATVWLLVTQDAFGQTERRPLDVLIWTNPSSMPSPSNNADVTSLNWKPHLAIVPTPPSQGRDIMSQSVFVLQEWVDEGGREDPHGAPLVSHPFSLTPAHSMQEL
jgi:hypothetical protein